MVRGLIFAGSVTIAVLALLVSQWTPPSAPRLENIRQGRNNTVLFLSCNEHGLSNVHVATAYALLERHPEVEVHYASFPPMGRKLGRVSDRARQINPSARSIVYHELPEDCHSWPVYTRAEKAQSTSFTLLVSAVLIQ
ncbi:hypothetical protein RRF57_003155 [Xylaria bambusicola]|uniref:Uncharacterized protein n=1 Tax=Xylaria bambusicola TaxID=326684 RepID=A0AAN7YW70_9PEZI